MILSIIIAFIIIPVIAIAGYQHYKIGQQPAYNANETLLNYEIVGSGENKLVLLHGLTGSLNYWKRDMDNITTTHKLLLVDLIGFGNSPKPKSDYSLSVQLRALEIILKKKGFNDGNIIIGGHSMGAIISLALLEKHPNWFKAGIFVSIPVYKDADEFKQVMSTHSFVDRISTSKLSKYICMIHPIFMSRAFKPNNLTDDVYEDAQKHHWQSYYYSLNEVILKTDVFALVKNIKDKDVLFIHGEKDTTAPLENALSLLKVFTNAKIVTSTEGDHQFFLQEADFVWQTIQGFSNSKKIFINNTIR
ncbi:Lipase 3 [Kordia antarctica]|uniref:Lipase 3 n=1 Tax=Kordia antarctica TaxID=1218801 RepID=A0A7L4ZJ08_9FLAO|nr:alpha/beta hydrolase [Kordia antarctica]QHI36585.1 Lipase 3 [Kordia antarctica]